jgi:hypothetical protein
VEDDGRKNEANVENENHNVMLSFTQLLTAPPTTSDGCFYELLFSNVTGKLRIFSLQKIKASGNIKVVIQLISSGKITPAQHGHSEIRIVLMNHYT